MHVNITAQGIELTGAIREYAERKIGALERFFKNAGEMRAEVVVAKTTQHHREGEVFKAEVSVFIDGERFYSDEVDQDLYAALDKVQSELERIITNSKAKKGGLLRRGGRRIKEQLRQWRGL